MLPSTIIMYFLVHPADLSLRPDERGYQTSRYFLPAWIRLLQFRNRWWVRCVLNCHSCCSYLSIGPNWGPNEWAYFNARTYFRRPDETRWLAKRARPFMTSRPDKRPSSGLDLPADLSVLFCRPEPAVIQAWCVLNRDRGFFRVSYL